MQSPVRFRVPEKVPGSLAWCKAKSGSTGFRRKFPEKVPEKVGEAARSGSTGFRRRFGEAWCGARSGSTGFLKKVPEKVWKALVQSRRKSRRLWSKARSRRFRRRCGWL